MDHKFEEFKRRSISSLKTSADMAHLLVMGFIASIYTNMIPITDCSFLFSKYMPDRIGEEYISFCESSRYLSFYAVLWICFSFIRILFISSKQQAGPILKSLGLKIEQQDGSPPDFAFAARYVFFEWLPVHLLTLYFLTGLTAVTNLYEHGIIGCLAMTAHLVWTAPYIFKRQGKNLQETMTNARLVFLPQKAEKIEKKFHSWWQDKFFYVEHYSGRILYIVLLILFVLPAIQILRTPKLNPEYERVLYANRQPVWEDNLYFAIAGLSAPADVEDYYAYGRAITRENFKNYERLKKLSKISYPYEIPEDMDSGIKRRKDQELDINENEWEYGSLSSCYFSASSYPDDTEVCITKQNAQLYISENQIIWDRFNNLPDYPVYNIPPQLLGGDSFISNMIPLARLKISHIITLAEEGKTQQAFHEWNKYWNLYLAMGEAKETMVYKAFILVNASLHLRGLNHLLYISPELAETHSAEITKALTPQKEILFRADHMLSDDMGLQEPGMLGMIGNVNAIRNDTFECFLNSERIARLPASKYPFKKKPELCRQAEMDIYDSLLYSLSKPGFYISNIVMELIIPSSLKGLELVDNSKELHFRMRMYLLGVEILKNNIAIENIPAFIAASPKELQNPVTRKPFEWDAETKSLFYISPRNDRKIKFYLNL